MFTDSNPRIGFQHPCRERTRKRRRIALAQLLLTLALALSTVIALTAVSIGMARADSLRAIVPHESGPVGVALLLGSVLAVMGALTAFATHICEARARR